MAAVVRLRKTRWRRTEIWRRFYSVFRFLLQGGVGGVEGQYIYYIKLLRYTTITGNLTPYLTLRRPESRATYKSSYLPSLLYADRSLTLYSTLQGSCSNIHT